MLEKIREGSQGVAAKSILGLVILTFALAGIGSYLGGSTVNPAAVVNGEEISTNALDRAYENERARMQQQMGAMFEQLTADPSYLRNFKENILQRLIGEKLAEQRAVQLGLRISDAEIKQAIVAMPEFQTDGAFDNNRYLALLRQAGYQPSDFRDYVRTQMTRAQLLQAIAGTEFALEDEVKRQLALQQQTRTVEYVEVPTAQFADVEAATSEEIEAYYNANLAQFDTNEQVAVEYIKVSAESLSARINLTEDDLRAFYEQTLNNYRSEPRRRVAHILIEFGDDQDAARAKAEEVLAAAQSGADFAELAKTESADLVSAEQGGDLDWFERGIMDPAFEEAAFTMTQVGDLSEVVESSFGYHVLKLLDSEEEVIQSFEQVQDKVTELAKQDKAAELFYDVQTQLNESAFENPDTLEIAAEVTELQAVETALFDRMTVPEALNNPTLIAKMFDAEFIAVSENSDLMELPDGSAVVARVIDHKPVSTKSLTDVSEQIATILVQEKQQAAAAEFAAQIEAAWGTEEATSLLAGKTLELKREEAMTRYTGEAAYEVRSAAFAMALPAEGESSLQSVKLANGNTVVLSMLGVNATDVSVGENDTARMSSQQSQRIYQAYLEAEKATADITLYSVQ